MNTLSKIIICTALVLPGIRCSHASELAVDETVWQGLHIIDGLQTASIRSLPCVIDKAHVYSNGYWTGYTTCARESSNPLIGDGWLIGSRPSTASVAGAMLGESVLHLGVTYALRSHPIAVRVWEYITIGCNIATIGHNAHIGLQIHF